MTDLSNLTEGGNPAIPNEPHRLREADGNIEPPKIVLNEAHRRSLETGQFRSVFDDEAKIRFVELLSKYGIKTKVAKAIGICPMTYRNHEKNDPDFAEAMELAMDVFRDSIEETIIDRAIHGWVEPVVSAGKVVAKVRKFDNRLLEFLAKRHIPAYREKQQVDVNVSGGVLVAPAPPQNQEDWQRQFSGSPAALPDGEGGGTMDSSQRKQVQNEAERS